MAQWNPWHGCKKISPGCQNCYVYRIDAMHGKDASEVHLTKSFDFPLKKNRQGVYKIESGETIFTCFSSDFLLEEADQWRTDAWQIMKARDDLNFYFITKRIERLAPLLPADWGSGYDNVHICTTVENQAMAEKRLPFLLTLPIKKKSIICEPLLERIDLSPYLTGEIKEVTVGGESGSGARVCDYDWVLDIRKQCIEAGIPFNFKQTGAMFRKDGKVYTIPRKLQMSQAKKANIDVI